MSGVELETAGYGPTLIADLDVGKKILNVLEEKYPLHAWFVNVMTESGYCTIQLMYPGADQKLRIWRYGVLLHTKNLATAHEMQPKVMRAGGEILERYNMARGRLTANSYSEFVKKGVDTAGMVK